MLQDPGKNFAQSEKAVADEARKLIHKYERLLDRHVKTIADIHDTIIAFGRKLQEGRDMYGPGVHFGDWIKRHRLNTGSIAKDQPERTACMLIAQLHDVGIEVEGNDDGSTTPARLDLTGCRSTTPTDIMKWARKTQRHLFPHLAPLGAKSAAKVANGDRRELLALLDRVLNEVDALPGCDATPQVECSKAGCSQRQGGGDGRWEKFTRSVFRHDQNEQQLRVGRRGPEGSGWDGHDLCQERQRVRTRGDER
jgi:hypothetical protein